MKTKIFAVLAGIVLITAGCVKTVSDTNKFSVWPVGKDKVLGRYERSLEQVYQAAFKVVSANGVVVQEYIPHDTSNNVRSLQGKVDQCNVWISVSAEDDPKITSAVVQVLTKWGTANIELASQLQTQIALQLQTQSGGS
ncbi:MAG TPA: hypothetical protein VMB80_05370 [Candidatus Acidoferrum sp.]|nr:hypothetical protein [Candidatus Acidoferrum sp.]